MIMNKTVDNFTFIETPIKDVYKIDTKKYGDNRGYFVKLIKRLTLMKLV